MKNIYLKKLSVVALVLIFGCAKEMEERLPENAEREIHSIESFNQVVVIETIDESPQIFKTSSNQVEQGFLALNELKLRRVRMVEGPAHLRPVFEKLRIESSEGLERFEVLFKLTDNRLNAFLVAENKLLSSANKQLVRTYKNRQVVPLFHYPTINFGTYKKRLNSLDEATRFLDFEVTNRTSATHVRFTATPEGRKLDGLYGKPDSSIFLKSSLHGKHWNPAELARFFDISNSKETVSFLSTNSNIVKTEIIDNKLFVYRVVSKESLDPISERFLEKGDLRVKSCEAEIKAQSNLKNQNDCVLVAVLSQEVNHVRLDLTTDNGEMVGTVEIKKDVDSRQTNLVEIPLEKRVQRFRFQDEAAIEEENVFRRRNIDNTVHNNAQIKNLMKIDLGLSGQVKTKLIGENLLFLVPRAISSLHPFEIAAVESGDPRYDYCSTDIQWNSEEACVLVPLFSRKVTYSDIRLRINQNNDLQDIVVDTGVDRKNSQLIQVDINSAAERFKFTEIIGFGDSVVTIKSQQFDLNSEYLYVPMTHGTPREVTAANPFFQGNEKIVRMRFVREGLEIYEQERDERFRNNTLNDKPVILIPGAQLGFKCLEDAQGDCTLTTIPDTHLTWDKAPIFLPEFRSMKIQELNTLDLFGHESDPCIFHVGTQLVGYTVEKGVLNIELEKTYKTSDSWRCIAENYFADTVDYTGFSNAGFKVQFNYSMVKLDNLASKDYQPVAYPVQEHSEFGFFKNYKQSLDNFFDARRMEESYLLNRWNPKKKDLVYHLSDSFNEPGQELIKKATYTAVDGINRSLKEANAEIQIRLVEPSGKKPGDLRHNVIQLVTDPLSNGLLGYAPSVKNPRTGEIVSAHINMYSGVLQGMTRRVWENMVDHSIKEKARRQLERAKRNQATKNNNDHDDHSDELEKFNPRQLERIKHRNTNLLKLASGNSKLHSSALSGMDKRAQNLMLSRLKRSIPANYVEVKQLTALEIKAKKENERLDHWARNNAYAEEFFRVAHTAKALLPGTVEIPGVLNNDGTLKRWDLLTQTQKKAAADIIVPYAYTSTFVHEFGHNLGLRHNFSGSFDAANFYSEDEAKARGLRQAPAYSSIMDYAFSEMNELTIFGKYDVAALRFAYAREVELKNGEFVKVETTLTDLKKQLEPIASELRGQESSLRREGRTAEAEQTALAASQYELKDYRFCTDDNAGLSSTCNRFDEGTTLVEITKHMIESYEDSYRSLNFRDERNEFKDSNLLGITLWNMRRFEKIRDVFEEWEFFTTFFDEALMVQGCGPSDLALYPVCKDINDRRDSVILAGEFFLKVLKTPDHLCAVLKNGEEDQAPTMINLGDFYEEHMQFDAANRGYVPKSCFDRQVVEKISEIENGSVIAQAGQYFNDIRGNDDRFIYADDRTVVGSWVDRVLAMKSLLQREKNIGLTETGHMALADHPAIQPQFFSFMSHLLLDTPIEEGIAFTDRAGNKIPLPYSVNKYVIKSTGDNLTFLKSFLGLNTDSGAETSFAQPLLAMVENFGITNDRTRRNQSIQLHNDFAVRKADISQQLNSDFLKSLAIDDTIYSATQANYFASQMLSSIESLELLKEVQRMDAELIAKVVNARSNPDLPSGLTDVEAFAITIPAATLELLITVANSGQPVTLELFTQAFGPQNGPLVYFVFNELRAEGLSRILEMQATLGTTAPADASEIEQRLYQIDLEVMVNFMEGTLEQKIEHYKSVIRYMPANKRL